MALPVVDTNQPQVKELISAGVKDIANMIFKSASVSITAAAKAVVPSIPEMVAEITEDLKAGPVNRFSQGLEKLDKLLMDFGGNIKDYSKELAKFVDQREARINKSEETIRELRENNVKAEITQFGEVKILSRKEIEIREKELKAADNLIKQEKEKIATNKKLVQEERGNTKARRDAIVKSQNTIIEKEKERTQLLETLNKKEEDTSEDARMTIRERAGNLIDEYVPDGLRDVGAAFTEGLMAPFTAIKELGLGFMSMLKPLKAIPKMLKAFSVGLLGAIAAMVPYLLIAAAIVVGLIALKKGFDFLKDNIDTVKEKLGAFADAVMEIPGQISDFFKSIFTKIKNFFIDAINGVIGMVNKVLPEKFEIQPLEREPDTGTTDVVTPEQQAAKQAMTDDSAYIVPNREDTSITSEDSKEPMFEKFKNLLKLLKPDAALAPAIEVGATGSGATIIDNSVKSVNQNNNQQSIALDTRNNDSSFNISNRYKDV